MSLGRFKKRTIFTLSTVLLILIGIIIAFLSINREAPVSSLLTSQELFDHAIYSNYDFIQNDSVINIGIQPMYLPTGIIMEVVKRDNILNRSLSNLGKIIKYHPFLKGADVNFFMKQKMLDAGVGGDMPALSIASSFDVIIPVILQKGYVSIVSEESMLIDDFVGKKIAYAYGSISHYFILKLMQISEITEDMVKLRPMEVTKMADALSNREIDLFSGWEPMISLALKQNPDFQVPYKQLTTGYFYFSTLFFQMNQEESNQILAAIIRSINWIKKDKNNLLLACKWNLNTIERLTGDNNTLSVEDMADLALNDLFGYYSKYSLVIKDDDISINSNLHSEFEFLKLLNKEIENINWKELVKSFNSQLMYNIMDQPNEYDLNKYDYEIQK